ncbi:hypothetical protein ACSBOB_14700 [Mesorhizobium sp. ASY16-5R]|uniref:hypothetical protein n=1 Tax=Mesorhizobium sp. ASY16-5R TaxID=3445772 RepID=UPI003FA1654F
MAAPKLESRASLAGDGAADMEAFQVELISPPRAGAQSHRRPWEATGERKKRAVSTAKPVPMRWPKDRSRYALADLWFFVAAQIAETKNHFRLLLALTKAIRRDSGTTTDGNETLARWAGNMDPTEASKAVSFLASQGLVIVEIGFAGDGNGKLRKSRTIRLAMPDPFPEGVSIDLPYAQPSGNQVVSRAQVDDEIQGRKTPDSSWARVPDAVPRAQISMKAAASAVIQSPPLAPSVEDVASNSYAAAKTGEAAPVGNVGSAAGEVAKQSFEHALGDGGPKRPPPVDSPSSSAATKPEWL